jgi:hypothetical protein
MSAGWSLLLTFAVQSMTIFPVSWWWYNQVTAVLSCLFLSAALLLVSRSPQSAFDHVAFVVSAALLSLGKANVAGPLLVLVFALLIAIPRLRRKGTVLFGFAGALALAVLVIFRIDPLETLASYRYFAGDALSIPRTVRFLLLNESNEVVQTFALIMCSGVAVVLVLLRVRVSPSGKRNVPRIEMALIPIKKEEVPYVGIGFLGMGVGLWGMMTNNEFNMSDAAVMLLGIAAVTLPPKIRPTRTRRQSLIAALMIVSTVLLATNGLRYTVLRYRVRGVGPGAFFENAPLTTLAAPPLFRGVSVGPRLVRVLADMNAVLADAGYIGQPDAPVFFGPRIDFGYASYGIRPYRGLPTWWEFFGQDGRDGTDEMVKRFKSARFKLCIFLHRDYTFFPITLMSYLNQAYEVYDVGELTIHILKAETRVRQDGPV